jgi:hypothetical protein
MADIHKFTARVIDLAERLSDVADAASGTRSPRGRNGLSGRLVDVGERLSDVGDAARGTGRGVGKSATRWIFLPAAGAALYALARSEFVARQAKEAVDEAKTRASELPNDLLKSVKQNSSRKPASRSARTRSTSRSRSSARKPKSSR